MDFRITNDLMKKFPVIGDVVRESLQNYIEYENGLILNKNSNPPVPKTDRVNYIYSEINSNDEVFIYIRHDSGNCIEFYQTDVQQCILKLTRKYKLIDINQSRI